MSDESYSIIGVHKIQLVEQSVDCSTGSIFVHICDVACHVTYRVIWRAGCESHRYERQKFVAMGFGSTDRMRTNRHPIGRSSYFFHSDVRSLENVPSRVLAQNLGFWPKGVRKTYICTAKDSHTFTYFHKNT